MLKSESVVGTRVKSLVDFSGVAKGTEGIIDEDYDSGVMVAWDLPDRPLPPNYHFTGKRLDVNHYFTGKRQNILRDGFDKEDELHFLEVVS